MRRCPGRQQGWVRNVTIEPVATVTGAAGLYTNLLKQFSLVQSTAVMLLQALARNDPVPTAPTAPRVLISSPEDMPAYASMSKQELKQRVGVRPVCLLRSPLHCSQIMGMQCTLPFHLHASTLAMYRLGACRVASGSQARHQPSQVTRILCPYVGQQSYCGSPR